MDSGNGGNAMIYPNSMSQSANSMQFSQPVSLIRTAPGTGGTGQHALNQTSLLPMGRPGQPSVIPVFPNAAFTSVPQSLYLATPLPHLISVMPDVNQPGNIPVPTTDNFSNSVSVSPMTVSTAHNVSGTTFYTQRRTSDDLPGDPREPLYQEMQMEDFRKQHFPDQLPPRDGILPDGQCFSSLATSPGRWKVLLFPSKDHYIAHYCNYYFSKENLTKDMLTVEKLKKNSGYLKLSELGQFPKLVFVGASEADIEIALSNSGRVEVVTIQSNERCVRRRDLWYPSDASSTSGVLSASEGASFSPTPSLDSISLLSPNGVTLGNAQFPTVPGQMILNPVHPQHYSVNFPTNPAYSHISRFPVNALPPNPATWQFPSVASHYQPGQVNLGLAGLSSPASSSVSSGAGLIYPNPSIHQLQHPYSHYPNGSYVPVTFNNYASNAIPSITGPSSNHQAINNVATVASSMHHHPPHQALGIWPGAYACYSSYVPVSSNPIAQSLHAATPSENNTVNNSVSSNQNPTNTSPPSSA